MNSEYTKRGEKMNWLLKTKIVERFGTQSDFALALRGHEADVSRVIRGRRTLTAEEQRRWADLLQADCTEIFGKETTHVEA